MIKILVIDPIVSSAFSGVTQKYLSDFQRPDLEFEICQVQKGPSSIETFFDEAFASPEILRIVQEKEKRVNAIVINCFAEPALHAARDLTQIPVVGPAEASVSLALMLGNKFAIISTLRNSGPWSEMQIRNMGLESRLAGAVGIDIPVLELNSQPEKTVLRLEEAARNLIQRGAEVIILGCTGMAMISKLLREKLPVPVIEPLSAAVSLAESLVRLKLVHYKGGIYMLPNPETIKGYYWD
ncbi:MAG: aspartate/glutamate racemase family protein [bacterium]